MIPTTDDPLLAAIRDAIAEGPTTHDPRKMLDAMRAASDAFYAAAFRIGCHGFIEFAGLMNEYISVCRATLDDGTDFTQCNTHSGAALKMQPYHVGYLTEKLDCIFGPTVVDDPKLRAVFMRGMQLPDAAVVQARLDGLIKFVESATRYTSKTTWQAAVAAARGVTETEPLP